MFHFTEFVLSEKVLLSQHSHYYWSQKTYFLKLMMLELSLMSLAARRMIISDTWVFHSSLLSTSLLAAMTSSLIWKWSVPLPSQPHLYPLPENTGFSLLLSSLLFPRQMLTSFLSKEILQITVVKQLRTI